MGIPLAGWQPLITTLVVLLFFLVLLLLPAVFGLLEIGTKSPDYGDVVAICSLLLTIGIGVYSLIPNLRSIAAATRSTNYSQLDTMYQQILSLAVERPHLRVHAGSRARSDPAEKSEYDSYAFIVWNFVETVRDRCEDDQALRETWGPVIAVEHALHRDWFIRETVPYLAKDNPKFCLGFADFIWRLWPEPHASSGNCLRDDGAWMASGWDYREAAVIERDPEVRRFVHGVGTDGRSSARSAATGLKEG